MKYPRICFYNYNLKGDEAYSYPSEKEAETDCREMSAHFPQYNYNVEKATCLKELVDMGYIPW